MAYRDYEKGLNARAFGKVSNRATGEDLVQETFMKTWRYLAKGGKIIAMKPFLYHILNCLIVDEYRKRKTTSLDILLEKDFDPSINATDRLFNILDGRRSLLLIARLPLAYQKVMRMRFAQELSFKEMSLITGLSKSTLGVQVHRGLAKLKLLYSPA